MPLHVSLLVVCTFLIGALDLVHGHDLGPESDDNPHFHTPPDPTVKELHVVFSNHFDAGIFISDPAIADMVIRL